VPARGGGREHALARGGREAGRVANEAARGAGWGAFGREYLSALTGCVRTHLVGHSFGGKLAASAVLGSARPESLTLLLAAFSAFAFAPEVPGFRRPGVYRAVVTQRRVERPIVVVRSEHNAALHRLSWLATSGAEGARSAAPGRGERPRRLGDPAALLEV
jgi:hypothetical protein